LTIHLKSIVFAYLFSGFELNEVEVSSLIEHHFDEAWASRTPINWDNDNSTPTGNHVAFTIIHATATLSNLGNEDGKSTSYRTGLVTVQVFIRQGTGTETSRDLSLQARQILEGYRSGSLRLKAGVARQIGEDNNGFWQANVDVPFEYYDVG
jgi:Bacteriophage related domain of unknown function